MKITLLVVGRTVDKHFISLIDDYSQRLTHYVPFQLEVIPELKNTKSLSQDDQKEREGQLILKQLQDSDDVVLLDDKGQDFTSIKFSEYIQKKMLSGKSRLVFVVGGPYGFSQAVYSRADGKVSLSKMTFSHQMVRLIFVEQLYRAMTIMKGEPYHHE